MTTIQLTIDEAVLEAARKRAAAEGKTLDAWFTGIVAEGEKRSATTAWVEEFISLAESSAGDSRGRKWTRDEIHDE